MIHNAVEANLEKEKKRKYPVISLSSPSA